MERFVRGHYRLRDAPARSHPAQRRTASADGGRDVWPAAAFSLNSGLVSRAPFGLRGRNAHGVFGARGAPSRMDAVPASQFTRGPSGGQKAAGACRDKIGASRAARLEGLLEAEERAGRRSRPLRATAALAGFAV